MTHFSNCGAQCSDPYCGQQDFLPMLCDACDRTFCSQHFSYSAHSCAKAAVKDRRVIVCPICNQSVPHQAGEDENVVFERHCASGKCNPQDAKAASKPKCPVPGCREKLTAINTYTCGTCSKRVCMKHRFEDAHSCAAPAAASSSAKSMANKQVADRRRAHRAPAVFGEVLGMIRRLNAST